MKSSDLFDALGEVNGKYLIEAQERAKKAKEASESKLIVSGVEVMNKKHVWRKVTSTAVIAATVVLIVGTVLHIGKNNDFGKNIFKADNNSVIEYNNLDLSNIKIAENIPKSGEWKTMIFEYHPLNADTINILNAIAKAYNGDTIDENNVFCNIFQADNSAPPKDIAFPDITSEMYNDAAYMRYIGDNLYIDTTIHGKVELYNRKNVKNILGIEYDEVWSWRPSYNGSVEKNYELQTGSRITDSYRLNDKQVSVDTALLYALSYLNSGKLSPICSAEYEYSPLFVDVYKFDEEKYGYYFTFNLSYDGVPLDSSSAVSPESAPVSNTIKLLMLSEDSIDWLWTCPMNQDAPVSQKKAEINIDYERACEIVSEALSQEHVFKVSKAELLYCTTELTDENTRWIYTGIKAEPMWQFHITNVGVQEYSSICIDVSAVDGRVYMRYE
ncbi:MAG: hypothetical protein IKI94_06770 [Ruminococcus sp.]|nr:hypothetical protein [Ruminococcus sp.]